MSLWWTLYRVELTKLLARRLPLVAAVGIVLLALASPWLAQLATAARAVAQGGQLASGFDNGWTALADAVQSARVFLVLILLVLASSTVSEEAGHGTLKSIFLRPVGRTELLLAKLLATWSYALAVMVLAVGAAALGSEATVGLYDVVDPVFPNRPPKHAFGDMASYVYLATGLSALPLLALTCLGLLTSCLFDHSGYATGVSLGMWFFLTAAGKLGQSLEPWVFVTYVGLPFQVVGELGNQFSGVMGRAQGQILPGIAVSLAWSAVLFAAAAVYTERRDVG